MIEAPDVPKSLVARTALILLPLAVVTVAVLYVFYRSQLEAFETVVRADEKNAVEIGEHRLTAQISAILSDLRFLTHLQLLQHWLDTDDPAALDGVARNHLAFAQEKLVFDQVRFIDAAGREIVRADYRDGKARILAPDELQDKSDRPYVRETLRLERGQVHISPFELNVERGAIERPLRPTIRFATPVFDRSGRRRGAIILNYNGEDLLDRIRPLESEHARQIWLVNEEGYWLHGPNPDDLWAFMYPDRQDRTLARAHPDVWRVIQDGISNAQFFADGDLYTVALFRPGVRVSTETSGPGVASSPLWILVSRMPAAALAARTAPLERGLALIGGVLLVVFAAGSFLLARHGVNRAAAERTVRASAEKFRSLLESAPDAVVIADAQGRIALVNAQSERLFGRPRDKMLGQPVEMLVPERFRGRHVGHRTGYAKAPQPRPMGAGLELFGLRADGTEFPVAISLSPVETEEGRLFVANIRDVTEQRESRRRVEELSERLERDNAALQSVNSELEAFSYSVSHDLRAPLRAIDGFSQALAEDCADRLDEAGQKYLRRTRQAAQRMGVLIDDLLKLARITRAELAVEDVDLSALADDVAREIAEGAPGRGAAFSIAPGLSARGDPRLLRVVLENLLSNAWKFSGRDGNGAGRIEFGRTDANGTSAYYVRDDGVGFDMAYAGKLFGAFQRLHDATEFPGTGIGLATAQRVIRKHGGAIWAESEVGKGATFYFTL